MYAQMELFMREAHFWCALSQSVMFMLGKVRGTGARTGSGSEARAGKRGLLSCYSSVVPVAFNTNVDIVSSLPMRVEIITSNLASVQDIGRAA
jgi:hypothetical protein